MASTDPITSDPRRFSIRLPRPLWIGVATAVLVIVAVGLRIGLPVYRQQVAIRAIERVGGSVRTEHRGSAWLRTCIVDEALNLFDQVVEVWLSGPGVTDDTLLILKDLHGLKIVHLGRLREHRDGRGGMSVNQAELIMLIVETIPPADDDRMRVTDAGLEHLKSMKGLTELHMQWADVTDVGVAALQRALPGLKIEK